MRKVKSPEAMPIQVWGRFIIGPSVIALGADSALGMSYGKKKQPSRSAYGRAPGNIEPHNSSEASSAFSARQQPFRQSELEPSRSTQPQDDALQHDEDAQQGSARYGLEVRVDAGRAYQFVDREERQRADGRADQIPHAS
jgi:hypothetical protein